MEQIPAVDRGGAAVIIVARTGTMSVSAPGGTARAAGGQLGGEVIPVENSLSRKVVYGKIIAADTVEVDIRGGHLLHEDNKVFRAFFRCEHGYFVGRFRCGAGYIALSRR